MTAGWTEDPELAAFGKSTAHDARLEQQRQEALKQERDSFVSQYGGMIEGGFAQVAQSIGSSREYRDVTTRGPEVGSPYEWSIRGIKYGEPYNLLSITAKGESDDGRAIFLISHLAGISQNLERLFLDDFSEQWFREVLRKKVRDIVS